MIQKYVDCNKCGRIFALCFIDDERRIIDFYPMDYFDKSKGSIQIYDLNVEQILNPEDINQKFISISCPECGNFSIRVVDRDWIVSQGFIEILASSFGVETIDNR